MFSLQDPNIYNLAIDGMFDDCQDIVKAVTGDRGVQGAHRIGTVNSINWARVAAQVVYYFKGYFAATTSDDEQVSFAVPSGNFGNILAGHVARAMGLPIERLMLATNENDVLDEFFRTGRYRPRSGRGDPCDLEPSMDISKASNFERFVFDLAGRDPARLRACGTRSSATAASTCAARRHGSACARRASCRAAARTPTASTTIRDVDRALRRDDRSAHRGRREGRP